MIFSDRASDLLESVMHHVLHSDVQSLIVVSPDVSAFLHTVWGHFFPDEDQVAPQTSSRRLFFQPNDLRDKESIDTFVDNLRQNRRLKLHHVVLLTESQAADEEEEGENNGQPVHYQYLMCRLQQTNLLSPQSQILITSQSVRRFFTMCQARADPDVRRTGEGDDGSVVPAIKWMLIGNTSRISINNIPRLVSEQGIWLFLRHWLSFVVGACLAMNPDYIAAIIIATLESQKTASSFFIYGKVVK